MEVAFEIKWLFFSFYEELQPRRSLVIYKTFSAFLLNVATFSCVVLSNLQSTLSNCAFYLIHFWTHIYNFHVPSAHSQPSNTVCFPLTFPWLGAFLLGSHQKSPSIFHVCTKTNRLLPRTTPTTAPWCSGGFAHWRCPWKTVFTFPHWYTGRKEISHNYVMHSALLTLHLSLTFTFRKCNHHAASWAHVESIYDWKQ